MRDELPIGPFILMVLTIAGCTGVGYLVGGDVGDIIGLGVGLVLGLLVFGLLSNMSSERDYYRQSQWRFDEAHMGQPAPRMWLSRLLRSLRIRR